MSNLKLFLQRTGRDLKHPTGEVDVIVDLNLPTADQTCLAGLQAAGLVVREVILNKVVGTMPAERIEELRQLDSVREVELSVPLQRHQCWRLMKKISVISDLHLCPNRRFGNISEETGFRLVEWTRKRLADGPVGSALVLAGDIVDFLLVEDRPTKLDLRNVRRFVKDVLQQLTQEFAWVEQWRTALTAYGEAGGQVVLLSGNHDPEWLHPDAAHEFEEWLAPKTERRWLSVCRDSDSWNAQVGAWEVKVIHGHRHDPINDIDRDAVFAALKNGADSFPLPWGSQLVLGPLRHFKQALDPATGTRRFAFLDALKPEIPGVLLLLLALDPQLAATHLPSALAGFSKFFVSRLAKQLSSGTVLLGAALNQQPPDNPSDALAAVLAQDFAVILSDADRSAAPGLTQNVNQYLHNSKPSSQSTSATLGLTNAIGDYFLRAWLNREQTKENAARFFDRTQRDATDDAILHAHLGENVSNRVVVAGHTHAAREIRLSNNCSYLNTGTWTNLMDLSSVKNMDDLPRFLTDLEAAKASTFTRLTWAEITPEAATLQEELPSP